MLFVVVAVSFFSGFLATDVAGLLFLFGGGVGSGRRCWKSSSLSV